MQANGLERNLSRSYKNQGNPHGHGQTRFCKQYPYQNY